MKPRHFLKVVEHDKIIRAIVAAETRTSGEIRVFVSHQNPRDVLVGASHWFKKLKMNRTPQRNGVLIFIAPRAHKFAIVGDRGIHSRCGEAFWLQIVNNMQVRLKKAEYTDALVDAVSRLGEFLARHFPAEPGERKNYLSDSIVEE